MATHDDPDLERWVDDRMAALGPTPKSEPETEWALEQLRTRATAARQRPVHVWLLAAGATALLVAVLVSVERWRNEPGDFDGVGGPEASSSNVTRDGAIALPTSEWASRRTDREVGTGVALSARRQTTPRLVPVEQRTEAPDFSLPAMESGHATLADYAGRVLLLNFWATWCGPCRIEMPWFVAFQNTFAERGFGVLGVSVDDTAWDVVRPFLDREPVNYRIAVADTAERLAPFGPITVLPTTWLIDRRGRLAAAHVGLVDRTALEAEIRQLLAE